MTAIANVDELRAALHDRGDRSVRLLGTGTRLQFSPPPPATALPLSLRGLDRIRRLEPDDLTCSVEPGVRGADLQRELQAKGLDLGIDLDGTVGGFFAADPTTAASAGAPCARSTLLGVEALLADGTPFKAGAQVVKSVAGFDVHKLLVGSRGLLFAVTLLHLKLRPRPVASVDFATAPGDIDGAAQRFLALRRMAPAPVRLSLCWSAQGACVTGRFAGRARWLDATLRAHELAAAPSPAWPALPDQNGERIEGLIAPRRAADLLRSLPTGARARVHGSGRFQLDLPTATASDALLAALPRLEAAGAIVAGAPTRRGTGTPRDAIAMRLERDLKQALDPHGVFV